MTTISALPAEVLMEIFLFCDRNWTAAPDGINMVYARPDVRSSPLLPAQICSRWRCIALNTPRLWCSLYLDWSYENMESNTCICETWFARSGVAPLSLGFNDTLDEVFNPPGDPESDDPTVSEAIIGVILPCKDRIQNLSLCLNQAAFVPSFAQIFHGPNSLPLLKALLLESIGKGTSESITLSGCNKLNKLLFGCGFELPTSVGRLKALLPSNLTHFMPFWNWSPCQVTPSLRCCPNLKFLDLGLEGRRTTGTIEPLTLPALEEIRLQCTIPANSFINSLTLPRLLSFTYEGYESFHEPLPAISTLLKRSGQPPLGELHIDLVDGYHENGQLVELFRLAPKLVTLVIWSTSSLTDPLFSDETVREVVDSALIPDLKNVDLEAPVYETGFW